ncbi:unnamed protein product [Mycena citricolor]|uniref:HAT C-terminal dimerisation domain-containing protein n=1 Tax=Mycena citricolor TaxID=2018698 RepID=A0AAD2K770_9AGAR|nr:unnamed protein product [Mycena citricolor]
MMSGGMHHRFHPKSRRGHPDLEPDVPTVLAPSDTVSMTGRPTASDAARPLSVRSRQSGTPRSELEGHPSLPASAPEISHLPGMFASPAVPTRVGLSQLARDSPALPEKPSYGRENSLIDLDTAAESQFEAHQHSGSTVPVIRSLVSQDQSVSDRETVASQTSTTMSRAMQGMSVTELVSFARRHQAIAQEALAAAADRDLSSQRSEQDPYDGIDFARLDHGITNFNEQLVTGETFPAMSSSFPPMFESTYLSPVGARPAFPSGTGPSYPSKDKGPDPRNWGGLSDRFSEHDLDTQRAAFANFDEIRRMKHEDSYLPPSVSVRHDSRRSPTTILSERNLKMHSVNASGHDDQGVEEHFVDLQRQIDSLHRAVTESRASTPVKMLNAENKQGESLSQAQTAVKNSIDRHISIGVPPTHTQTDARERTPATRTGAGSFIERALRNVDSFGGPPPSEPPSSNPSDVGSRSPTPVPRRSRQGETVNVSVNEPKMILKPIPPKEYDGSPNAVAFHRFVKEGTAYLKLGRVPADERAFYLSYFMSGHAREFYNSRVENDEHTWTLSDFFWGLFNFCFPVNFREKQRSKLNACKQDDKSVLVHKAEWEQIFNTIGLEANQEKVVMFCRSLKTSIRKEMFRANLDPEMSTWDEVTRGAEAAEVIVNLDLEDADSDETEAPKPQPKWKKENLATDSNEKRRNGGRALSVSSAAVETPKKNQHEKTWDYVTRDGKIVCQDSSYVPERGTLLRDSTDWEFVEQLIKALEILELITKEFSLKTVPTLPKVLPFYKLMETDLEAKSKELCSIPNLSAALLAGSKMATKYINKALEGDYPMLATLLHPALRLRFFQNSNWDPSVANRAKKILVEIVQRYLAEIPTSDTALVAEAAPTRSVFGLAATMGSRTGGVASLDASAEIELYFGGISPVADMFDDPLGWWKDQAVTLKGLARAARDILGIPGVSISVERLFLSLRHTLKESRMSMTPEKIAMSVSTKEWIKSGLNEGLHYTDFIRMHSK